MSSTSVPLSALFSKALQQASKAADLPTKEQSTQNVVQSCLSDLSTVQSRIEAHSIFSPNEAVDDIATRDLIYLSVPYVLAELLGRVYVIEPNLRVVNAGKRERYYQTFISFLENYDIVPEDERTLFAKKVGTVTNPTSRRELKVNQYKKTKDIRARIETIRKRRDQKSADEDVSDYDLLRSLIPTSSHSNDDKDEENSETDDIIRETTLLLLRMLFALAYSQIEGIQQELELLRLSPPPQPPPSTSQMQDSHRLQQKKEEDNMWKLDAPSTSRGGSLLDSSGKPLQPFTILPSQATDRARVQTQVFGPGYRLPTMSIDEYLEIERARGNVLTSGGPGSENEPTSSEALALAAEMDGTLEGQEKEEEKRLKDEKWAVFTDENPRGIGNTMNRG